MYGENRDVTKRLTTERTSISQTRNFPNGTALHRDGTVAQPAKGNLFKGPFHIPRMMIKSFVVCNEISNKMLIKKISDKTMQTHLKLFMLDK